MKYGAAFTNVYSTTENSELRNWFKRKASLEEYFMHIYSLSKYTYKRFTNIKDSADLLYFSAYKYLLLERKGRHT